MPMRANKGELAAFKRKYTDERIYNSNADECFTSFVAINCSGRAQKKGGPKPAFRFRR